MKECGGSVCKPATFFTWERDVPFLDPLGTKYTFPYTDIGPFAVADLDGNGRDDILFSRVADWNTKWSAIFPDRNLTLTSEISDPVGFNLGLLGDYDQDGRADVLVPRLHPGNPNANPPIVPFSTWDIVKASPDGNSLLRQSLSNEQSDSIGGKPPNPTKDLAYADMDGDGRAELVRAECALFLDANRDGRAEEYCPKPFLGDKGTRTASGGAGEFGDLVPWWEISSDYDQIYYSDYGIAVGLDGTCPKPPTGASVVTVDHKLLDVNGDGLVDIIRGPCPYLPSQNDPNLGQYQAHDGKIRIFLSTGTSFIDTMLMPDGDANYPRFTARPSEFRRAQPINLRQGGKGSLLIPEFKTDDFPSSRWTIVEWGGEGSLYRHDPLEQAPPYMPVSWTLFENDADPNAYVNTTRVGDFDGDGLPDLLNVENGSFVVHRHLGKRERITAIRDGRNGHGATSSVPDDTSTPTVSIRYKALTEVDAPYNKSPSFLPAPAPVFPVVPYVGARDVVSSYDIDLGGPALLDADPDQDDAAIRRFRMSYKGAREHVQGRGWLGFSEIITSSTPSTAYLNEDIGQFVESRVTFDPFTPGPHDSFPFAQVPGSSRTYWIDEHGTYHVTLTEDHWETQLGHGGATFATKLTSSRDRTFESAHGSDLPDITEAPLTDTKTAVTYDDYLTPVSTVRTSLDGHVLTSSIDTITNDESTWSLGLPVDASVTDKVGSESQRYATHVDWNVKKLWPDTVIRNKGSTAEVTSSPKPDGFGNVVSIALSAPTSVPSVESRSMGAKYDEEGYFPIATQDAMGFIHLLRLRDTDGNVITSVDPNALATRIAYDQFGRRTQVRQPDGTSDLTTYGLVVPAESTTGRFVTTVAQSSAGSQWSTAELDRVGRPRRTIHYDSTGNKVFKAIQYDPRGTGGVVRETLSYTSSPDRFINRKFDHGGRLVEEQLPGGSAGSLTTTWAYSGLQVSTTNPRGVTSTAISDAGRRVIKKYDTVDQGVQSHDTTYKYGPFGRIEHVLDTLSNDIVTAYDDAGRVKTVLDPDAGLRTFGYDAFGQLRTETDAAVKTTTLLYDRLGRLTTSTDETGTTTRTYDTAAYGVGKPAVSHPPNGADTKYSYDSQGRLSSKAQVVDSVLYEIKVGYDTATGRLQDITYPTVAPFSTAFTVRNTYDVDGRLTSVSPYSNGVMGDPYWKRISTNVDEQIEKESFGNGDKTTRAYDHSTGAVVGIQTQTSKSTLVQDLLYGYDRNGNTVLRADRLQKHGSAFATETFYYDPLDRLCDVSMHDETFSDPASFLKGKKLDGKCEIKAGQSAPGTRYAYDVIGNLRFKSDVGTYDYTSPRPHAVTKAGSIGYEYDKNGNQNVRGNDKVEHTPFFLPSKVQKGGVDTLFQYNADHQRVSKRNDTAGTLVHYVDGLFERRKKGGTTEDRLTILGPERPIAIVSRTTPNGTVATRYLHVDALGSSDVISSSDGSTTTKYSYDAFGAPRSTTWIPLGTNPSVPAANILPSQGYTGHEDDDELGLVNMKGRIYDPKLGRMLQADMIVPHPWFGQSFNRYSYVYNNPLSRTDPSGHCPGPEAGCTPGQGGGPSLPIDVKLPNPFGGGSSWSGGNVASGGGNTPAASPPSRFDNDPQASGVGGRIYTNSPEDVAAEMSAFRAAMANNPDSYLSGERVGGVSTPYETPRRLDYSFDDDGTSARDARMRGNLGALRNFGLSTAQGVLVVGMLPVFWVSWPLAYKLGDYKYQAPAESWVLQREIERREYDRGTWGYNGVGVGAMAVMPGVGAGSAIGFTEDAVATAYNGMRGGGGHAMRHLMNEGLITNTGSLESRVRLFQELTSPILRNPTSTFDWRIGDVAARAFAGQIGGKSVVLFVAKEGPYQGRVLSAIIPDAAQLAQWGL